MVISHNQSSTDVWKYVGYNQSDAQKLAARSINAAGYVFHGQLKGNLNVETIFPEEVQSVGYGWFPAGYPMVVLPKRERASYHGRDIRSFMHIMSNNVDKIAQLRPLSPNSNQLSAGCWENRTFCFSLL